MEFIRLLQVGATISSVVAGVTAITCGTLDFISFVSYRRLSLQGRKAYREDFRLLCMARCLDTLNWWVSFSMHSMAVRRPVSSHRVLHSHSHCWTERVDAKAGRLGHLSLHCRPDELEQLTVSPLHKVCPTFPLL